MEKGPLRAGVAEIELKPELGLATGDGAPWATGYKTPLFVKALVLANGALLLIGSPLSATPHATIWWFLLGALLKLSTLEEGAYPERSP